MLHDQRPGTANAKAGMAQQHGGSQPRRSATAEIAALADIEETFRDRSPRGRESRDEGRTQRQGEGNNEDALVSLVRMQNEFMQRQMRDQQQAFETMIRGTQAAFADILQRVLAQQPVLATQPALLPKPEEAK